MAAISFESVSNVGTRFHAQRINRRLDDRDAVLKEALAQLEEKDHSKFPTVEKVASVSLSATAATTGAQDICVCHGTNFSTTLADYAIRVGGVSASVKASPTTTAFTVVLPATSLTQGDLLLVQVRISGVLCTEFFLTVA